MAGITIEQSAAFARISETLALWVTNRIIDGLARSMGCPADGTNKGARIRSLLAALWLDGRRRTSVANAVATLVMAGHERAVRGQAQMDDLQIDGVVADLRVLGLDPGTLAHKGWRKGLRQQPPPASPLATSVVGSPNASPLARQHDGALVHLRHLLAGGETPQARGHQLELILFGVLGAERLSPKRNVIVPGEEIDLTFVLDGHHYLVEAKWEQRPVGLPDVHLFSSKVVSKAEGTFGVVVSMSGFVADINEKASRGRRLNCVGLVAADVMAVLEGRVAWAAVIRDARRAASDESRFLK